jgi:hypothetical protein
MRGAYAWSAGPAHLAQSSIVAVAVAGTIATDGFQRTGRRRLVSINCRYSAPLRNSALLVGDPHLFNHAGIFGELLARHDAQLFG